MVKNSHLVHIIDELKVGGAQTHLLTMLRYLKKERHYKHTVISLFGTGSIEDELHAIGVRVVIMDIREELGHYRIDKIIRKIRVQLLKLEPDLVEAHLTWSRLLGLSAAMFAGVPKRIGYEQGDIYFNSLKFRVANNISQLFIQRYIVCSNALKQWVHQTHHISNTKLIVLHNCVDVSRFNTNIIGSEEIAKLKTCDNVLFVMVGTLGRGVNKRVDIGIKALAHARKEGADVSLVIAGDGDQRFELETLAKNLDINNYVHFLGMRSDIPQILRACDVFCHAAPFEPFGIVAIEAMACGLPAIVPDTGGMKEAVDHNINGYVYSALDANALCKMMLETYHNLDNINEMRRSAVSRVQRDFTVEQYVDQLYNYYGLD